MLTNTNIPLKSKERRFYMRGINEYGETTVQCRICGKWTPMTGTKLCDRCWELETRIERDPELARKILEQVDKRKGGTHGT